MDLKKTKRIWFGLVVTFLVGIFSLAVQPTEANVSLLDNSGNAVASSPSMFNFSLWTGLLAGAVLVLTLILVYLIISGRRKIKL